VSIIVVEFAELDNSSCGAGLSIFFWQETTKNKTTAKRKYLNENFRGVIK
jgi:hypothetical protein